MPLDPLDLALLALIFFLTSVVGVVTGSNSLITVPAMLQFGVEPRVAIATNMLALTFLSAGGALPFRGKGVFDRRRLPALALLTLAGSVLGALLLFVVPAQAMPVVIPVFMVAVALFAVAGGRWGEGRPATASRAAEAGGYGATLVLGVYGGFFSGGYVTLLTAAFVRLFGMTLLQAVATTKLINVCSSLVATLLFAARGLVDYRLGLVLSAAMFAGGLVGARMALRVSGAWLRRIFVAVVLALAAKMIMIDVLLAQG